MDRVDQRIAVSQRARDSADPWLGGPWEIVPNGVLIPDRTDPGGREHTVVFAGRHEPRKGLHRLLRARLAVSDAGIDIVGFLSQDALTDLLRSTKALLAPSLGGESFGMVLTRAFACATPVVASDIAAYREVVTPETAVSVPAGDVSGLVTAVESLLTDEPRRAAMGAAARLRAEAHFAWPDIARRLEEIYERVTD